MKQLRADKNKNSLEQKEGEQRTDQMRSDLQKESSSDNQEQYSCENPKKKIGSNQISHGQRSDHANLAAGRNYLLDGQTSFDQKRVQQLAIRDQQTKKDQLEMAPSAPRTHATATLRMKQIALDNQDRTFRRLRAQLATQRRGLAATKKELEDTQVALEASHKVIAGLTEIGLSMSK
ncbi:hypothetical protein F511_43276 [Dorcoceras hygrometricum]|uniref:Uncharacterized protein n=1 Tax=Dorcoceras hygrometricum TaxID=472368 RepID=A0A2Z7C731_9LAMI|nr:hypothetical protein F511_43276 [Dorcoceras hygrometricum]